MSSEKQSTGGEQKTSSEKPSVASSLATKRNDHSPSAGHGESALPVDPEEEAEENTRDDWEDDPENPRNWSMSRKWICTSVVCRPAKKGRDALIVQLGLAVHVHSAARKFDDGSRSARNSRDVQHNKSDDRRSHSGHISSVFCACSEFRLFRVVIIDDLCPSH